MSRAVASIGFRASGFGLLGVLLSSALGGVASRVAVPLGVILTPALAVLSQWINYGHFPVAAQLKVSLPSAIVGALAGLALHHSRVAVVALVAVVVGFFAWGTSNRVCEDLDADARRTANHVLAHADEIRPGDEGFADAVLLAFSFAEDNSHRSDPAHANKAAILALGVIFGDEKVARVARREVDPAFRDQFEGLRTRVTLRGRGDLSRHFWVSAALAVVLDETRATTVGTLKELMDSQPEGSGFSFVDYAANRAGILFTLAATRDPESARATQWRIIGDALVADDYCPEIAGLPEGLTRDQFQAEYGGLGGRRTRELLADIESRMANKPVLRGGR